MEGDERDGRELPLIDNEDEKDDKADDQHREHQRRSPLFIEGGALVREKVEGQQEKCQTGDQKEQPQGVALDRVVPDRLRDCAARVPGRDQALFDALSRVVHQEEDQRQVEHGVEDGKNSKSPAPSRSVQHRLREVAGCECCDEVRRSDVSEDEASVLQLGSVGKNHTQDVVAVVATAMLRLDNCSAFNRRIQDSTHPVWLKTSAAAYI